MQGSKTEASLYSQNYRQELQSALLQAFPDSDVYDPLACNENSLQFTHEVGKAVFMNHNKMCGTDVDAVVAYVPEASMGAAIEMWEAWKNGAVILTISPMKINWVVKFLSDAIYPDIDSFLAALRCGQVRNLLESRMPRAKKRSCDDFIDAAVLNSDQR